MKKLRLLLIALLTFLMMSEILLAIPAFARKYNMSCKTCHSPAPSLKAYGEEFAGNGFVLADQDAPRYFINTGDDDLSLLRDLPLALRMEGYLTYTNRQTKTSDLTAPYILKILSGGSLGKDIAYYFYFFFSERGEVAGIEDAFLMFNNVFSSNLDLFIGQYQVSDPLFKRELRLSFEDYQIYRARPGISDIDLTYDRGLMLTYGFDTGTDFTFEILNGSGIGAGNSNKLFDKDVYKNFLGRISQDITENIRVGAFGYYGKESIVNDFSDKRTNTMWMAGPDLTISAGPLELKAQYVERMDDNIFPSGASAAARKDVSTRGAFGELIYRPEGDDSKWYALALYNWAKSDLDAFSGSDRYESASLHVGYLLKRNIRLVGEYSYYLSEKAGRMGIGFISAF